jgi:dTDP-4-dehydrorhamnose reductase
MTVLITGAHGMLGHQLVAAFAGGQPVIAATRRPAPEMSVPCIVADLRAPDSLFSQIEATRPELVVNAAGVVKQRNYEAAELWEVNARFPHRLAEVCRRSGARLIHLSTDCVFSGREGGYTETDEPDPVDDYGRSKREGEPKGENLMVIRTSMIGLERSHGVGLVEWFLDQRGIVRGFSQAIFSGLTTKALSRLIRDHCAKDGFRSGIWHVGAEPISKFDLLTRLNRALGRSEPAIVADASVRCDRSLDFSRYASETGYRPPGWTQMIDELAIDIKQRSVNRTTKAEEMNEALSE